MTFKPESEVVNVDDMLRIADKYFYVAKETSGNKVVMSEISESTGQDLFANETGCFIAAKRSALKCVGWMPVMPNCV